MIYFIALMLLELASADELIAEVHHIPSACQIGNAIQIWHKDGKQVVVGTNFNLTSLTTTTDTQADLFSVQTPYMRVENLDQAKTNVPIAFSSSATFQQTTTINCDANCTFDGPVRFVGTVTVFAAVDNETTGTIGQLLERLGKLERDMNI